MRLQSIPAARAPRTRRILAIVVAVFAVAGLGPCAPAAAATFTVDPTQIFLSERTNSVVLTLSNGSDETLRFQLSAFAWTQSRSGEMQLEPTEDVVFFPALLTVAPGETRRVRVGRAKAITAQEQSYRIFVEELPPLTATSGGVRVLTKMGIPIFLRPQKEVTTATLENLQHENGRLRFSLANTGTVHFVPRAIRVSAMTGTATAAERQVDAWYVLAGGRRDFDLELDAGTCTDVRSLVITAQLESSEVQQRMQTPNGVCAR